MGKLSDTWIAAGKKGAAWLVAHQGPKGNYIGREAPDARGLYPDVDDLAAYYKSVYPLRIAGESAAAARMLQHILDRFGQPNGDLVNSPTQRTTGSYTPNFCQLYPNMWIVRGANALRWYDAQEKLISFIFQNRDPQSGGFYATVEPKTKVIDANATGVGVMVSIHAGRYAAAQQTCDLLLRMLDEQPDPQRLYFRYIPGEGFETDYEGKDEKYRWNCYIDSTKEKQAYWPWGMPMINLANMWALTGERKYLDGAVRIFDFLDHKCHADAFHHVTAGKCGWGAAILYRLTGDRRYRDRAVSQMEFLLSVQHADGYFMGLGVKDESEMHPRYLYDYTGEWTTWLIDTAIEFAAKGE
ncbi:MAG: hypothetical protein ABIL09_25845 [Gemmatimonadota bacterium]